MFEKGKSGNPAGRPKGSKNKLQEAFWRDFADVWAVSGKVALEKVAAEDPSKFVQVAASVMPKEFEADIRNHIISDKPMSGDEWRGTYTNGHLASPAGTAESVN